MVGINGEGHGRQIIQGDSVRRWKVLHSVVLPRDRAAF